MTTRQKPRMTFRESGALIEVITRRATCAYRRVVAGRMVGPQHTRRACQETARRAGAVAVFTR